MKDIVIPYLKNNSGELDACIALIKKNVPHRNIYVVESFNKVGHFRLSHINQILKLDWALKNLHLSEEFYLFNDDFFVMEPVEDIPYMHRGTLSDHIASRMGSGVYTRALKTTREQLLVGNDLSYEVHVPFIFNRHALGIAIDTLRSGIESGRCPLIRSWYGNNMLVGGIKVEDVKNPRNYEGKTYLSTTEHSFKREIGDYIRSKL